MPKSKTSLNELLYDIKRIAENREKLSEKKIKAIYQTLEKELSSFIAEEYVKFSDEEGRLYTAYLDAQNQKAKFLQEIANNVQGISPEIKAEIAGLVNETYSKSFEGMLSAFKTAEKEGVFEKVSKDIAVNPKTLKQAINNNISKLTLPTVLEKHRNEIIYQIQQELSIGLMQGDRYEKMAKRLSERISVSNSKAMNIVRTESHRNVESGLMDCAEHIQEGLEGSDLIYAATWRTMKDERVRPQQRVKTKKGWKTYYSKNGANHQKMEGVTVKAGELFNLGGGVKAKAPSQSGVAAHDCRCRCYLEYNLMTVAEFAKATGQTEEQVRKKYFSPIITNKQFGKKAGKHTQDFGMDASKPADREKMQQIISDITLNYDNKKIGSWKGQAEEVLFFIKGNNVVVTKQDREFITILKEGINNERVKNARKREF